MTAYERYTRHRPQTLLSPDIIMSSHQLPHSQTLHIYFSAVLTWSGLNCGLHLLDTTLTVGGGSPIYGLISFQDTGRNPPMMNADFPTDGSVCIRLHMGSRA